MVRQKPKKVLAQIWPAVQIALHLEFASLNRPGTPEDDAEDLEIGLDQVALYAITEDTDRNAADLNSLAHRLSRFFAADLGAEAVTGLANDFWSHCGQCFEADKGITFEQHVAQELGIDYEELQRLAVGSREVVSG